MRDIRTLELAGPAGVIALIASAEACALALSWTPTSPLLWYLNLEVLRPVQYGLNGLTATGLNAHDVTDYFAAVLLVLAGVGFVAKIRLATATASNLSFLYGLCLLFGSYQAHATLQFRLDTLLAPSRILIAGIFIAATISSIISHRGYWSEMLAKE